MVPLRFSYLFFLAWGGLFAQVTANGPADFRLYVRGDSDDRYCVFGDADAWKSAIKSRDTSESGTLIFEKGSIRTIEIQYSDETGDWSANDIYHLDDTRRLTSLSRIVRVRDGTREETWSISGAKATRQQIGKRAPQLEFVPELPVVTDLKSFPFWIIVDGKEREIRSKGMVCTATTLGPAVISSDVYVLRDSEGRWCAFKNRSEWNSQVSSQKPFAKGTLGFVGERLGLIQLFQSDELGRWTVLDAYGLDAKGSLSNVQRTIFGKASSSESWSIKDGKATRYAATGPSVNQSAPDYPAVQTRLDAFGFWPLIRDKRREISTAGRACQ